MNWQQFSESKTVPCILNYFKQLLSLVGRLEYHFLETISKFTFPELLVMIFQIPRYFLALDQDMEVYSQSLVYLTICWDARTDGVEEVCCVTRFFYDMKNVIFLRFFARCANKRKIPILGQMSIASDLI